MKLLWVKKKCRKLALGYADWPDPVPRLLIGAVGRLL